MEKNKCSTRSIQRVVWYKDENGIWNGLILRGPSTRVNRAISDEITRLKAEGFDGHVTDGFNKIDSWTCETVQA